MGPASLFVPYRGVALCTSTIGRLTSRDIIGREVINFSDCVYVCVVY